MWRYNKSLRPCEIISRIKKEDTILYHKNSYSIIDKIFLLNDLKRVIRKVK